MLTWLVSTSLHFRVAVLALCAVLVAVGTRTAERAPLDVFPEFAPPIVEIQTEAPGLSATQVEELVTAPLENALNGTAGVKTIRSKSVLGLSQVVLLFDQDADVIRARQLVQERLATESRQLPAAARPPVILQPLSSTSRVLKIGVWSEKLSQRDLTILAMWTIRPKLMSVPGVANVAIWGQRDRELQVHIDPTELRRHGVSLDSVSRAAADAVVLDSGGFVDTPNQRMSVRHLPAVNDPDDLARTVVDFRGGVPVHLGDVAGVDVGSPPPIGDAVINDGPGLLLIVEKHPWGNTLDVTRQVEEALETLKPGLADVHVDHTIFRPATFIERSIKNLTNALLIGCGLVVVILVAFLFDWRTALISLMAIPLSLLAASTALYYSGASINTMVLAGLVIALGEVVDDAIIDVENISRRLRLNRELPHPLSAFRVVLNASLEVRSAVVYATLIVVLVFVPVFFLGGLSGTFFRPLAKAYVLAILASLLVALTVTPAMCLLLLPSRRGARAEAPLTRWLKRQYRAVLPVLIARPWWAIAFLVAALAVSAAATRNLGQEFLPNFRETDFLMHWVEKPGTSIEANQRITAAASKELRSIPGVRNFGSHIGRAEVADEVVGPNFTELWISIDDGVDYNATLAKIQEVVDGYPGLYRDVQTYLKERIKEVLTGAGASIVVRLYGPDLGVLRAKAKEVETAMADVPGVTNLKVEPQVLVPQVDVRPRTADAAKFGLTPGHIRRVTTLLLRGQKVGEVYDGPKRFAVTVWAAPKWRTDVSALQDLPIDTPTGTQVRLGDVADVKIDPTPNEVRHEAASRRIDITCNVKDRDLGSVARDVEQKVRAMHFDREYRPEFLGEYAAREESTRRLYWLAALALAGIAVLLYTDFGSLRLTIVALVTLPFALIGGVAGVLLTDGVLSLGSLVGFVTVLGIAARNGIMLVSHYRHLEDLEGVPFGDELVLRGAEERLSPILMTALATALALLPLVIAGNRPGHEIEYPLAVVILGGLVTSTMLNLFLLPALYRKFGQRSPVGQVSQTVRQKLQAIEA
ncbi:MAG TPA: efflux RND transporter permease subunit [Gemmataceae bacterium]|nr:efflux RND transporter permease subunit [Gemmataceae bacterium]